MPGAWEQARLPASLQPRAWVGLGCGPSAPTLVLLACRGAHVRCDACDELFPSKLDLRRHKKYACSLVGAAR